MSTIPYSYSKTDDHRPNEPSVLEQLARNHISSGQPVRLSDSGSVSVQHKSNAYAEPESDLNQLSQDRERFPFIASIETPSLDDLNDHENEYSVRANKPKTIKRRRKVVKQRRRGGYGGRRRSARKVDSEEQLPFTPRERQQHNKETMERKKRHEKVERRGRFESRSSKDYSSTPSKENLIYHSPTSYSYSSFHLGSSS